MVIIKDKLSTILIILFISFCILLPMSNISVKADTNTNTKIVSLSITTNGTYFDQLISWVDTLNYTKFKFIIEYADLNSILSNSTKLSELEQYGNITVRFPYMQALSISARKSEVDSAMSEFQTYLGYYPAGYFDYMPDTWTSNYVYSNYNMSYVQGYCFDQYAIDYMTERGGWQLPYYASSSNILVPNTTDTVKLSDPP